MVLSLISISCLRAIFFFISLIFKNKTSTIKTCFKALCCVCSWLLSFCYFSYLLQWVFQNVSAFFRVPLFYHFYLFLSPTLSGAYCPMFDSEENFHMAGGYVFIGIWAEENINPLHGRWEQPPQLCSLCFLKNGFC